MSELFEVKREDFQSEKPRKSLVEPLASSQQTYRELGIVQTPLYAIGAREIPAW